MKITDKITITNEDNMLMMARYPDKYFDLAIVDPPYFDGPNKLGYYGKRKSASGVIRGEYKKIGKWGLPTEEYFKELYRVSKNQIVWGCNYYEKFIEGPGRIFWDKCNSDSSFSDGEIASCSMQTTVRIIKYMWNGMMQGCDFNGTMQGNKQLNEKRIHPTQKPVALYKWLLDKYAKQGDKILDTHLGSGSIAIACHDYGFELTACELDQEYYQSAIDRIRRHTNQLQLFTA